MKETLNWLNGIPLKEVDPTWGVNRAFFYGESIFTSTLIKNNKILFLDDHLKRLSTQVSEFFYNTKANDHSIIQELLKKDLTIIDQENIDIARLRMTLFFDDEDFELSKMNRLITLMKIVPARESIKAKTHRITDTTTRQFKLGAYASQFYLKRNLQDDFNDVCLINSNNEVLELITSNIFFVNDGSAYFPKFNNEFLDGITFNHVKKALSKKYEIITKSIRVDQLNHFESAYACNAIKAIIPIQKIDQFNFKNSCLCEIQKLWSEYVIE